MRAIWRRLEGFLLWLSGASATTAPVEAEGIPAAGETEPAPAEPSAPIPDTLPAAAEPVAALTPAAPFPIATRPSQEVPAVPDEVINDAVDYDVEIVTVDVPEGTTYWRVVRVHHLTPEENHGNHHIYLDALDEAGNRVVGAQARVTWEGGQQTITVDKPQSEPGTNFPMWKWQVCAVEMLGIPSDRVTNLHTGHPDEPPGMGNTLFHHSFHVDFKRTVKAPEPLPELSVISGVVANGEGLLLLLIREGSEVARMLLGGEGVYRFENLAAGTYILAVEGTEVRSGPVTVDGTDRVTVNLEVPAGPTKPLKRYLLFGPPGASRTAVHLLLARDYLANAHLAFGFRSQDAIQAQEVIVVGGLEDVSSATEAALVGNGCRVQRIQGTAEEISAAFMALQEEGHPLFMPSMTSDEGIPA